MTEADLKSLVAEYCNGTLNSAEFAALQERVEQLAKIIAQGVQDGDFVKCDQWEVADILWTLANGLIQTEGSPARRSLRRRPLDATFTDAVDLVIRGLSPTKTPG